MNSKPVLLAILSLWFAPPLFAQTTIGVEGGFCYNSYHTNIANRAATDLTGGAGFSIALPLRYRIYPWLYAVAGPDLAQKGYSMNRTDSLAGEYDQHTNTYLQLPIGVSLVYERHRWRIGLDLGLYAGYWLYGRIKGRTADIFGSPGANGQTQEQFQLVGYDQRYTFDPRRDNRWEEGWWLGPGLQYRLTGRWWLTAGARYYQSLTSQEKTSVSPIPAYNRTWIFSIGGAWSLPKPKSRV
jgi:opacity protein-like surface antigen